MQVAVRHLAGGRVHVIITDGTTAHIAGDRDVTGPPVAGMREAARLFAAEYRYRVAGKWNLGFDRFGDDSGKPWDGTHYADVKRQTPLAVT